MREKGSQGGIATGKAERAATRNRTPCIYVPLRFRIGGIEGVRTGAAIVGTPQGDGMIAIDVQWTPDVEPNQQVWEGWIGEAATRHSADDDPPDEAPQTRFVSEAALIEVGRCVRGRPVIDDSTRVAQLARWIQAGRSDYLVEAPFPHQA